MDRRVWYPGGDDDQLPNLCGINNIGWQIWEIITLGIVTSDG